MTDIDPFDLLLDSSAPRTSPRTPELREELTRMVVASSERRAPRPRRRVAIGAGVATMALLASAGTAAASGLIEWKPWAQDPDVVYGYTLPSGEGCELRIAYDDEAAGKVAREIAAETDLASVIDVEAQVRAFRSMPTIGSDEFGNSWDAGYGTEFYPGIDEEYDRAVQFAVDGYLFEELTARGVARDAAGATLASTCSIGFAGAR